MSEAPSARTAPSARGLDELVHAVEGVVVGQRRLVERLLIGLLCDGHLLLEGVPGLAKSLAVETLAAALDVSFRRIQFTPDLLPADLVGTPVFQPARGAFEVRKGPIFANLVLADEINRAPAKVHSALLEAMQERKVSIDGVDYPLPDPFLVLATQNPVEQEGTYPLPEAELDRFLMKVVVDYPSFDDEREIVLRHAATTKPPPPRKVADAAVLRAARADLERVYVDERLVRYVLRLVRATRAGRPGKDAAAERLEGVTERIRLGASPRAAIAWMLAARGHALLSGRDFAGPADVKAVGKDVLRHRLQVTYEAEAEGLTPDAVIDTLLERVEIP